MNELSAHHYHSTRRVGSGEASLDVYGCISLTTVGGACSLVVLLKVVCLNGFINYTRNTTPRT